MSYSVSNRRRPIDTAVAAHLVGMLALAVGLVVVVDQVAVGSLDAHLHEIYDPVGKYSEPGALYAFLYAIGGVGIVAWSIALRTTHESPRSRFRWSLTLLVVSAPFVLAPLIITEYDAVVIPFSLSAAYAVAWLVGVVAVVSTRHALRG